MPTLDSLEQRIHAEALTEAKAHWALTPREEAMNAILTLSRFFPTEGKLLEQGAKRLLPSTITLPPEVLSSTGTINCWELARHLERSFITKRTQEIAFKKMNTLLKQIAEPTPAEDPAYAQSQ